MIYQVKGGVVVESLRRCTCREIFILLSQLYAYRRKLDYTIFYLEKNELLRGICAFGTET